MFKTCNPELDDGEWDKGMREYLKSPTHKANLRKDLEILKLYIRGGSQSCDTEEHC